MSASPAQRIERAVDCAADWAYVDGAHHKQWVIDQMLRHLLGDAYDAWVESCRGWDEGLAP